MGMRTLQALVGLEKLKATGDGSMLDGALSWRERHPAVERYDEVIYRPAIAIKDRVAAGELDPVDAGRAIYDLLQAADLGPIANKASYPQNRYHGKQSPAELLAEARWFFGPSKSIFKSFHSDLARYAAQTAVARVKRKPALGSIPRAKESLPETLLASSRDLLGYMERLAQAYPFATLDIGARRAVLVSDLDLIDEVFIKKSDAFGRPRALLDAFNAGPLPTGEFLMSSVSFEHDKKRRQLGAAFTPKALASYAETIIEVEDELIDRWAGPGERRPVLSAMTAFTLEVAGLTLFGTRIGGEDELRGAFEQWTADIDHHFRHPLALPRSLPTPWNMKTRRAVRTIAEHLDACVEARRRDPAADRKDALGLLFSSQEEGEVLDPTVIRAAVLTLYLAGHDTTATALAWSLYLLGQHPEVFARLRAEADEVLGGARPGYSDLKRLPVALGVYKEALRLYPPTIAMVRESHRGVEIGGHMIPPGTLLIAPTYGIHRDARNYPDPARFDPDRWKGAGIAPTGPFFPFGAGPFSCLGGQFALMEGALFLARLAARADVAFEGLAAVTPKPGFSLKPSPEFHATLSLRRAPR
jgi:cytochrome P450